MTMEPRQSNAELLARIQVYADVSLAIDALRIAVDALGVIADPCQTSLDHVRRVAERAILDVESVLEVE